jgi:hypothetical protein
MGRSKMRSSLGPQNRADWAVTELKKIEVAQESAERRVMSGIALPRFAGRGATLDDR